MAVGQLLSATYNDYMANRDGHTGIHGGHTDSAAMLRATGQLKDGTRLLAHVQLSGPILPELCPAYLIHQSYFTVLDIKQNPFEF